MNGMKSEQQWNRLDKYYAIRKKLAGLKDGAPDYCGQCYQPTCTHKVERINYQNAQVEMTWWADIALMEYPGKYLQVGEVTIIPTWPEPKPFEDHFTNEKYVVLPKIQGGEFGVIVSHLNERTGYNPNLQTLHPGIHEFAQQARFGPGAYWGYLWQDQFYLIRVYRGKWVTLRRLRSVPRVNVTGFTVPKFNVDFTIDGYIFMPKVHDNYTFQTRYFEL
jgi:hypothetical protein